MTKSTQLFRDRPVQDAEEYRRVPEAEIIAKVLPVPVPDTTSTRTCFWTLGAKENIRERNYLRYEEVHSSIVPGYKLRTNNLGTILV